VVLHVELYTPTEFAVLGRATDTGASFVDELSSSALLQPSPAASAAPVPGVVGDWTGSVRRPPRSLPAAASQRHCATLGPGRAKDPRRHGGGPAGAPARRAGPPADWLDRRTLTRLRRDDVRLLEKLGEGRFAEVHVRNLSSV